MQGILCSSFTDTPIKPEASTIDMDLGQFLSQIERRALIMAEIATSSREEALDLVQDSMIAFVTRYGRKPQTDWPPLFYRILQNRIRDWYRRNSVRNRWKTWLGQANDDADPIQSAPDPACRTPEKEIQGEESREAIINAVSRLPLRQQQAFLLRIWEGLDVANTARVMGCSQGSVKTHLSRAMNFLRGQLEEYR